jgi:hypothetical protein
MLGVSRPVRLPREMSPPLRSAILLVARMARCADRSAPYRDQVAESDGSDPDAWQLQARSGTREAFKNAFDRT